MNAPAVAVQAEPTEVQLRAAWARLKRTTWPDTFEEAMQDPVLGRMVQIGAKHPPPRTRHYAAAAIASPLPTPYPTAAPARPLRTFTPPPGYVDRMRAAAGERDDD